FYAMSYLKTVMSVDATQVDELMGIALLMATPFFVFFGWLSDKVGRKAVMMSGMLIAIVCYRPIYNSMYKTTDLSLKTEVSSKTDATFKVLEGTKSDSIYTTNKAFADGTTSEEIKTVHLDNGVRIKDDGGKDKVETKLTKTITSSDRWWIILMVFIQVFFVTMVYGPIAAFLVEMFPVRIRYTSMSLPYHVGNGIFGGLLPAISTYLVTTGKDAGDPEFYLEGLWYPIGIAAVCFVIGMIYLDKKISTLHD
ncbi:MAG TPA: hypothetical protein VK183_09130, partial [Flavobacterium sp.]|nr:hypothetical protein [Flavobacterium sp.]